MPCGMQRYTHAIHVQRLAIGQRLDRRIADAPARDVLAVSRDEITGVPYARMIAVRMRDHGTIDGRPWIDVEPAGRAVEPFRIDGNQFQSEDLGEKKRK